MKAFNTQLGFQRPRLVIDSSMYDTTVVSTLMCSWNIIIMVNCLWDFFNTYTKKVLVMWFCNCILVHLNGMEWYYISAFPILALVACFGITVYKYNAMQTLATSNNLHAISLPKSVQSLYLTTL